MMPHMTYNVLTSPWMMVQDRQGNVYNISPTQPLHKDDYVALVKARQSFEGSLYNMFNGLRPMSELSAVWTPVIHRELKWGVADAMD